MEKKKIYCTYCGGKLAKKMIDGKDRDYCSDCKSVFYENPLPVACSIVVNKDREVLLVKRKNEPYKDMWCLPIGFAETDEEVSHAALRELKEEAGVDGEIIRLIDVDTVDNYFYGNLAIVTYEVNMTGGAVSPGDDAIEAGFFPIDEVPDLAWTSNEKAINIYKDFYSDIWSMADSFSHLFPEMSSLNGITESSDDQEYFLSNALIKIIDININDISDDWLYALKKKFPELDKHSVFLVRLFKSVLIGIQFWLTRDTDTLGSEEYIEIGFEIKKLKIPLPEIITALALGRKSLWKHLVQEQYMMSLIEIYSALEINNRIIFFFDKIIYHITSGYLKK